MVAVLDQRFWSKVNKNGPIVRADLGACWVWMASTTVGYGVFWPTRARSHLAHRLSLEAALGRALVGNECALHVCDNPPCVNPAHLFVGARSDNNADKVQKQRHSRGADRPLAKLDEGKVRELREAYARGGVSQHELAERYGVNQSQISRLVNGRRWRHVECLKGEAE